MLRVVYAHLYIFFCFCFWFCFCFCFYLFLFFFFFSFSFFFFLFFFFQAEDGIRDIGVTGVQTCALPISSNVDGNPWTTPTNSSVRSYAIHIWEEPVWFTILRIALTSTIALVGALGNLAVSYVVTKRPEMWTAVNLYIRNLSLTDLGVLLINYPLAVMKERYFHTDLNSVV